MYCAARTVKLAKKEIERVLDGENRWVFLSDRDGVLEVGLAHSFLRQGRQGAKTAKEEKKRANTRRKKIREENKRIDSAHKSFGGLGGLGDLGSLGAMYFNQPRNNTQDTPSVIPPQGIPQKILKTNRPIRQARLRVSVSNLLPSPK